MSSRNEIIISESDYEKLSLLVNVSRSEAAADLKIKIRTAEVYPDTLMPGNIAALYSHIYVRDVNTGSKRMVTLVMPWEANVTKMRISILSPVGILLIGTSDGAVIEWPLLKNRSNKLEVVGIWRAEKGLLYA
ncbi:GreA/GreB family elongation factor [Zhongshania sp. BJYM1]|uniref:GreA/GreB family elongation factor n=1 Tax=Zhongshania aquatica TaxID=2965069 RepID=UPI0022B3FCD2|nr:GreA/GreB family elongation factor [Marortus sp. BJYM1]